MYSLLLGFYFSDYNINTSNVIYNCLEQISVFLSSRKMIGSTHKISLFLAFISILRSPIFSKDEFNFVD